MIFDCRFKSGLGQVLQPGRACSSLLLLFLFFSPLPAIASAEEAVPIDGAVLYYRHCASCHDSPEKNFLSNRSPSRIRSAIRHLPAMSQLRDMKDAELEAIAAILAEPAAAEQ